MAGWIEGGKQKMRAEVGWKEEGETQAPSRE